jgi:threonine synthase
VLDFFNNKQWKSQKAIPTLANAMDVSNPNNLKRILHLYPEWDKLYSNINVVSASDDDIKQSIIDAQKWWGITVCPHTATAVFASTKTNNKHNMIVATAHPAKFNTIVEPLIGKSIEIPKKLQEILYNPSLYSIIKPTLESLKENF